MLVKSNFWLWLGTLLAFVWFLPNTGEIMERHLAPASSANSGGWLKLKITPRWAFATGLLLAASILSLSRAGEFLYYNF